MSTCKNTFFSRFTLVSRSAIHIGMLVLLALTGSAPAAALGRGDLDTSFDVGTGVGGTLVWNALVQPDGKTIIGGQFTSLNGVPRHHIARLNTDGSLDTGFDPGTGAGGTGGSNGVYVLPSVLQTDGRIVIGGMFTTYNGNTANRIARLNSDGSRDTTFNTGTGANGDVWSLAIQPDGKILVGGAFTIFNGVATNRIVRLNTDGSVDTGFVTGSGPNAIVYAITVQADNRIILAGSFSSYNGNTANRIVRLDTNGAVDAGYTASLAGNGIYALSRLADGKLVLTGSFTSVNGQSRNNIARLNTDGSLDTGFNPGTGTNAPVYAIAQDPNLAGGLVIGGLFTTYNGIGRSRIAYIQSDGSLDTEFNPAIGANHNVLALAFRDTAHLFIGGEFTQYQSVARNRVAGVTNFRDTDNDGLRDDVDADDDNDGVIDGSDNCPLTANTDQTNWDGDNLGNLCDPDYDSDIDDDGVTNTSDAFPYDPAESVDTDQDGVGDNADKCPLQTNADQQDKDGDGLGDVCDTTVYGDIDADGIDDLDDNCAALPNADQLDTDADHYGDACDADQGGIVAPRSIGAKIVASGGDVLVKELYTKAGHTNELWLESPGEPRFIALNRNAGTVTNLGYFAKGEELVFRIYVRHSQETFYSGEASRNPDGLAHAAVTLPDAGHLTVGFEDELGGGDQDYNDNVFRFVGLRELVDTDGDGIDNFYDTDDDNDGVADVADALPQDASESADTDMDGTGNNADTDDDGDGVDDALDECPLLAACQLDTDRDSIDNAVDADDDNDGVTDGADNCPLFANADQLDSDGDTTGDPCDKEAGKPAVIWTTRSGANGYIYAVDTQSDGKALIGGNFSTVNGVARNRIARLNTDGSLDASFNSGTSADGPIYDVLMQPDGKILLAGGFANINGTARARIARLNADGSLDTSFNPGTGANNSVWALALHTDGKILLGGDFVSVNGVAHNRIARLNADGTIDTDFAASSTGNTSVHALAVQADGKILLGGNSFTTKRLLPSGSLDNSFTASLSGMVLDIVPLSDGRVLIGGSFTGGVKRVNSDGSVDTSFAIGSGTNAAVYDISVQGDKYVLAGNFTSWNGSPQNRLIRLEANGTQDPTFNIGTGANNVIYAADLRPDLSLVIGGDFTAYDGKPVSRVAEIHTSNSALDDDADYVVNPSDNCPLIYNHDQQDTDSDGLGNVCDDDDDNDGATDAADAYPLNVAAALDTDLDGLPDSWNAGCTATCQNSSGLAQDNCPTVSNIAQQDQDQDSIGDTCDADMDGDGIAEEDNCPTLANPNQLDSNHNGLGDACELPKLPASGWPMRAGANGYVYAVANLPNGKVVVAGNFTSLNGTTINRIARLYAADGSLDMAFSPGTGPNGPVYDLLVQPNGKIVVMGNFTAFNGVARNRIVRLLPNGAVDTSFDPGEGFNGTVWAAALQEDGKLVAVGNFTNVAGNSANRIARLNSNGSVDSGFTIGAGLNGMAHAVAIQENGSILVSGDFTTVQTVARNRIARLHANGALDTAFTASSSSMVLEVVPLPDGKVVYGGVFAGGMARVNPDGSADSTFAVGAGGNGAVYDISVQPDGKYLVAGNFTSWNGTTQNRLVRLDQNGTLDTSLAVGTGANSVIYAAAIQANGGLLIGGDFTTYNGAAVSRVAAVYLGFTVDTDNDGFEDDVDAFALDPTEWLDTDQDGIGNGADHDDDGDNVPDAVDQNPLDNSVTTEIVLPLNNVFKGSTVKEDQSAK